MTALRSLMSGKSSTEPEGHLAREPFSIGKPIRDFLTELDISKLIWVPDESEIDKYPPSSRKLSILFALFRTPSLVEKFSKFSNKDGLIVST